MTPFLGKAKFLRSFGFSLGRGGLDLLEQLLQILRWRRASAPPHRRHGRLWRGDGESGRGDVPLRALKCCSYRLFWNCLFRVFVLLLLEVLFCVCVCVCFFFFFFFLVSFFLGVSWRCPWFLSVFSLVSLMLVSHRFLHSFPLAPNEEFEPPP